MPLTDKQMQYLAIAWQCFESEPKIDYDKFHSIANLASAHSARELMRVTKKKLKEEYGAFSAAGSDTSGGNATPTTPRKKGNVGQSGGTSGTGTGRGRKRNAAAAGAANGTPTAAGKKGGRMRSPALGSGDGSAGEDDRDGEEGRRRKVKKVKVESVEGRGEENHGLHVDEGEDAAEMFRF